MANESDLGQQTRHLAEEQKAAGADRLRGVARAIHGAARELEDSLPGAAGYVHDAATKLDDSAATLRGRSVEDLFKSFNDLARREPGLVLAGAAIAGLAISRFLKASNRG